MAIERPSFRDQLQRQWDQGKFVCVGLDPVLERIPQHIKSQYGRPDVVMTEFCDQIVQTTGDLALAFKLNLAFFERYEGGDESLMNLIGSIHDSLPGVPVIGDGKRADIGATNEHYAALFDKYGFDAMTTSPYLGPDTYPSLLKGHADKGLIILGKTTNPGAAYFQDIPVVVEHYQAQQIKNGTPLPEEDFNLLLGTAIEEQTNPLRDLPGVPRSAVPFYWIVALRTGMLARENRNLSLVVGATHPEAFRPVRILAGDVPFLIPGIGTQGGDLEKTLQFAPDSNNQGMIINSGSAIIFASSGEDFADAARTAALKLDRQIREGLNLA